MMKMTRRVACCCVALLFALSSVSAVKKLDSIDDLKKIDFGQSVPAHSLVLLYWFAHTVNIDHNQNLWLTINPGNGDYGSHYYGNHDGLLAPPPNGQHYYIVGNLNQESSVPLPTYVLNTRSPYTGENKDRIIIRARGQRIDQVYITHHQGRPYDPHHTYQITTNLLRQIREFTEGGNDQTLQYLRNRLQSNANLSTIRNTWGHLACLGLFLFIAMEKRHHYPFQEQSGQLQSGRLQSGSAQLQSGRLQSGQNHMWNWNTGSAAYYTPPPQDDNLCMKILLVFIVAVVFLLFSAAK